MTHTRGSLLKIIAAYDREVLKWHNRGDRIVKRYRDERTESLARRFNVLWSNVETLKPFLYSATPKPIVNQRGDQADVVSRVAAMVLEKALVFTVNENHFGSSLRNARDDYLLPGRGTVWARYVPEFKPAEPQVSESNADDQPGTAGIGDTTEVVAFESAVIDYVHWKDFGHDLARTWEEVDVVWRTVAMNREALIARFGEETAKGIALDVKADNQSERTAEDAGDKALIYELWIKSEKRAVWLAKSGDQLLDDKPDPLKLDHFFPCPRPVYATMTTDKLIPVPDYAQYQDQAQELDDLTGRIALLTKAIKATGVYDASVPALKQLLDDGHDNTLIPVENWASLSERGGLQGAIELLPMKEVAETLLSLYEARDHVKADLYEVSGMSDIIRGNTAPEETATAQRIKSNFATRRLEERQSEVERFARNAIDLLGNIIAVHFSPETLISMTGMKLLPSQAMKQALQQAAQAAQTPPQPNMPPPQIDPNLQAMLAKPEVQSALDQPTWEEVIALLRNEPKRRFSIDIETDTMVASDDAENQQQTTQFVQGLTGLLEQCGQLAQGDPTALPFLAELVKFSVRKFRVGRDLMQSLDEYLDKKQKQAAQPQPPKPDPAMAKVQADAAAKDKQQQIDAQADEREAQLKDQQHQRELAQEAQLEAMKAHFAAQAQADHAARDQQTEMMKSALEAHAQHQNTVMQDAFERWKAELQARTQVEVAEISAGATVDTAQIAAANQATESGEGDE